MTPSNDVLVSDALLEDKCVPIWLDPVLLCAPPYPNAISRVQLLCEILEIINYRFCTNIATFIIR